MLIISNYSHKKYSNNVSNNKIWKKIRTLSCHLNALSAKNFTKKQFVTLALDVIKLISLNAIAINVIIHGINANAFV